MSVLPEVEFDFHRRAGACRFFGCHDDGGEGQTGLFCPEHAGLLGRMRAELDGEPRRKYKIFGTRQEAWREKEVA